MNNGLIKICISLILCVMLLFSVGCANQKPQGDDLSSVDTTNTLMSAEDKMVEQVIKDLKDYGLPIVYSIVYDETNDPNDRNNVTYVAKGNFSDSNIEQTYDKNMPLSGTIEVFNNESDAVIRAGQLKDSGVDDFASRILCKTVMIRLNAKYTEEQVNDIALALDGKVLSIDFDRLDSYDPFEMYPLVTYDKATSGDYSGQKICIDAVADAVDITKSANGDFNGAYLHLWFKSKKAYMCVDSINVLDTDLVKHKYLADIAKIKNGDIVRVVVGVDKDNKISISRFSAIKIIDKANLNDVYSATIRGTDSIEYDSALRKPDSFLYKPTVVRGSVLQVIDEGTMSCEYLIKTKGGIVHLNYKFPENARKTRLLENDKIIVYGTLSELYEYSSMTKVNKVPNIYAPLVLLDK